MPKVFISYSHDSDEHRDFVRSISDRFRKEGLDCLIDLYLNGFPPEGWQRWMESQIESADFVLLVCTETYLRRYRGQETDGGRGVAFEGVVVSQTLYDHYYRNTKFIPIIPANGRLEHVPLTLKPYSTYCLPGDYDQLYRVLTGQAAYLMPDLGEIRILPAASMQTSVNQIHSDRLPTVKGKFFGREAELQMLDAAWTGNTTRIIQLIAPGGTGKTKLLRHWLDHTAGIDALIAWSFYSQGASEDKQTSATPFFSHAFEKLGSTRERFTTEEDKGEHLADLLRCQRCVLVLDGLEPLQHAGSGMRGELKDRAIRQLLKSLAGYNNSLCIITTRIAVHELADRAAVISHNLQNLAPADGVKLLQSLGVQGKPNELNKAAREYGCHALALTLLGNVLRLRYQGDVQKRDTLKALVKPTGSKGSRHAFKVMQAYEEWLAGEPELALLHLLGLFDHPIEQAVLQVLWAAQIPQLTSGIDEDDWLEAIAGLREEHHLLSQHDSGDLDSHPLIREYFGQRLRTQHPAAWQQAHARLYEYYKALPEKEFPDTLAEMQPLFSAVAHGCAAGLHQNTLKDIYWRRIQRKKDFFNVRKLGAFSDDLSVLANFFSSPWHLPTASLSRVSQAFLFNEAGFRLRALGRLSEALGAMQKSVDSYVQLENWTFAAQAANNLSELRLILGDVAEAKKNSMFALNYADKSTDQFWQMATRTTYADALHQNGNDKKALSLFEEAERFQRKRQLDYPLLYSLRGFRYCDLLLEQDQITDVLERANYALDFALSESRSLLSIALNQLTIGRARLKQKEFSQAIYWLNKAIISLHISAQQDHLPRGLLARAALYRHTYNFTLAHQDLQEVFDIAKPSGMRLHLTDYHLEMARLLLAESLAPSPLAGEGRDGGNSAATQHITAAERLIAETGYHRRDAELAELQKSLA